ncbi:unnamed protein product [Dovyalis caffra]|uniref:F-box domain-containing protein n=1 Tax=Dovyalis caffra TaxID=77055 RepID=A0AAV1R7C3_9ROSI|nr:unnamed protein product [Dovyalis caffra]
MEASQETKQHMIVKSDEEGSTSIHDLPSCIMIEILSRLPLKTLVKSRSVCKLWNDYFLDPHFPVSYAANGPTQLLIPIVHLSSDTVRMVDWDSEDCPARKINIGVAGKGGLPLMLTEKHTAIVVKSLCNGFLCLCDEESGNPVSLWNPMLCEYVLLPEVTRASSSTVICGLGFADKKYKVVRIYKPKSTEALWEAEITTVGTDTNWRNIGKVCYELSASFFSANFDGIIHWSIEGPASELIYCLDVRNEKFSCLPPPSIFSPNKNREEPKGYYWSNIGVLEDSLYICARSSDGLVPPVEFWLMKEYGVKESWIRILNIGSLHEDWWKRYRRFELIKVLSDGKIVLLCGDQSLRLCDPRNRSNREVFKVSDPMIAVSPSFVSLKNGA